MTTAETEPEPRALAQRCVTTCRFTACTGRGSLEPWAHVCSVLGIPRAAPTCDVPGCSEPGVLLPRGRRCLALHAPAQPSPTASSLPSAAAGPHPYGPATTDPLGRDGAGWETSAQTGLPVWRGDGPPVRCEVTE